MIGRLTGIINKNDLNSVIIDVNGVGYLVTCSTKTMNKLADGERVSLDIETVVREDAIKLFGFISEEEKYWFNTLNTVQGVGFKACMAILNVLTPEEVNIAIMSEDKAMISRADGVGPKLASRVVLELKDKVNASLSIGNARISEEDKSPELNVNDVNDAMSALINLGYNRSSAFDAVNSIKDYSDINDLITKSLKKITSK